MRESAAQPDCHAEGLHGGASGRLSGGGVTAAVPVGAAAVHGHSQTTVSGEQSRVVELVPV